MGPGCARASVGSYVAQLEWPRLDSYIDGSGMRHNSPFLLRLPAAQTDVASFVPGIKTPDIRCALVQLVTRRRAAELMFACVEACFPQPGRKVHRGSGGGGGALAAPHPRPPRLHQVRRSTAQHAQHGAVTGATTGTTRWAAARSSTFCTLERDLFPRAGFIVRCWPLCPHRDLLVGNSIACINSLESGTLV